MDVPEALTSLPSFHKGQPGQEMWRLGVPLYIPDVDLKIKGQRPFHRKGLDPARSNGLETIMKGDRGAKPLPFSHSHRTTAGYEDRQ